MAKKSLEDRMIDLIKKDKLMTNGGAVFTGTPEKPSAIGQCVRIAEDKIVFMNTDGLELFEANKLFDVVQEKARNGNIEFLEKLFDDLETSSIIKPEGQGKIVV